MRRVMVIKESKKHLADNNMTYWEHFIFAFMFMIECLKMVLALIVHMFIPAFFVKYSSDKTLENAKMIEEMESK
jgi:hypothetical protein